MNFLLDKTIDALFICIGVYIAFWFDQYQQDQISKRELNFNLVQILRDLPDKTPSEEVAPFSIKVSKDKDGSCRFPFYMDFTRSGRGESYLKVIEQQGQSKFMKDRSILPILSLYYRELAEGLKKAEKKFNDRINGLLEQHHDRKNFNCLSQKAKKKIEAKMVPLYENLIAARGLSQIVGFKVSEKIKALGIARPERSTFSVNYNPTFKEPEEEPGSKNSESQ